MLKPSPLSNLHSHSNKLWTLPSPVLPFSWYLYHSSLSWILRYWTFVTPCILNYVISNISKIIFKYQKRKLNFFWEFFFDFLSRVFFWIIDLIKIVIFSYKDWSGLKHICQTFIVPKILIVWTLKSNCIPTFNSIAFFHWKILASYAFLFWILLFKEKEVVRQFSKLGKDEFQLSLIVHLKRLKRLERISIVSRKRFSDEVIYGNTFTVREGGNTRTPWKAYSKPSDKCFGGNFLTVSSHHALRLNQSYCVSKAQQTYFTQPLTEHG